MQCFGEEMEVWDRLMTPEWQLCTVELDEDPVTKVSVPGGETKEFMHICATDSPTQLGLFWQKNMVQEDSFQINLRRKTKRVGTNFFLD